jgi:cation diffusion facilitator CzcD-associated flavoprotein CzcO
LQGILLDNTYYRALAQPNVDVATNSIKEVGENYVVTDDGTKHEVDTLILGTGFAASGFLAPIEIRGRAGRELSAAWRDGAEAYLGITVSGFPNLFMFYGPNTNLGHNSIVSMLESQIQYIKEAVTRLRAAPGTAYHVKPGVQSGFNAKLPHALRNTVWAEGCKSWYIAESGKIVNNWAGFTFTYRRMTSCFDAVNYEALSDKVVMRQRETELRPAMPSQYAPVPA